jgi:tetratricopeptide (TPR) repeat protein
MDTTATTLSNKTLCVIGRFAAMSQREFRELAGELGCRCVAFPSPQTDFLVIGDEGCSDSAKPLLKAWELRKSGTGIQIFSESDFYQLAGQIPGDARLVRRFTMADLAKSIHVSGAKLRQWVRWGLLEPVEVIHRLEFFNFAAVQTAKRLAELTDLDFPITQIRKELEKLRGRFVGRSISEGDLVQQNGRLLIRHRGRLVDGRGQSYFDFSDQSESAPTLAIPPPRENVGGIFEQALLAEFAGRWEQAIELYQKALLLESSNPILFFNLGNTFYAQGKYEEARDSFRKALNLDDCYAEAWNNLGNAHLELEHWQEAIEAFGQALNLVSHYQDARQNLDLALNLLAEKRRTKIFP